MSIFGLPLILFQVGKKGIDMGTVLDLAIKEFNGGGSSKLRDNTGVKDVGAIGDLATLTATGGKQMYLAKATVSGRLSAKTLTAQAVVVLKLNGVIRDRGYLSGTVGSTASGSQFQGGSGELFHEFTLRGVKVEPGEIIKIEVISSNAVISLSGTLHVWEETDGETPQIPSI